MSTNNHAAASGATLSVDDLEAALRLLSAEERADQTNWRKLIVALVFSISIGIVFLAFPLGLLIVWFNPDLGWELLKVAVIAAIAGIVGAWMWGGIVSSQDQIRTTLDESLSKTVEAAWQKQIEALVKFVLLLIFPLLIGLVCLVYSLFTTGAISLPSLALIALPVIIFCMLNGIYMYRENEYLLQVSRLRDQLESRLQEVGATGSSEVSLSSEEMNLLSQVESRVEWQQVKDKVVRLKHESSDEQLYSIAIAPEPLKYLKSLAEREPEAKIEIRETWDELQTEPRPPEAQPAPGHENGFVIRKGQYDSIYLVDDKKRRIDVVKIQEINQEELLHGS